LPLRLDLPERQVEPSLALALVIDRSGSMEGARMELTKQAARATAEKLPADDQLAVVAFDSRATVVVPLQRAANRQRISTDIGRIQPNGGTNILEGLREAIDQLTPARAKKKHLILLSDGQSGHQGIAELVDAAAASRITLSVIGVGDDVDEPLLRLIAEHGGGRYYHTRDPAGIPRVFTREANEVAVNGVVERPTSAVARKPSQLWAGVPLSTAPPLGGYVRTRARVGADLLLGTDAGDPLLSRWPVGLGQVAAWTSDLGPRWAGRWTRWPPFGKLWAQIGRGLMRAAPNARFPLGIRANAGVVSASVEATEKDDRFVSGLVATLEITQIDGDGQVVPTASRVVPMPESAPGRYEATFPAWTAPAGRGRRPGALLLRASLLQAGRPFAQADGHLGLAPAPELRPPAADEPSALTGPALLAAIAGRTGGGPLAAPADLFQAAAPRPTSRPLRSPLLAALAALAVVDVALRRWAEGRRPGVARRSRR
jgi:Ca-activated chloride channel family protein